MKNYSENPNFSLTIYTILHFLVDFSCIFYVLAMVYMMLPDNASCAGAAILYNAMAFALPMILGLLADIAGFNALTACLGCLMILSVYLLTPEPWTATVLIGIGNGLFHIGGGRQVLQDSGSKYAPSGIFISSGALGVFLGRKLSVAFTRAAFISIWILVAAGALLLGIIAFMQRSDRRASKLRFVNISPGMLAASLLIFIVVIIRSFYGFVAVYSWNTGFVMGLIFTLCVAGGKFLGGIAADRFGLMAACIISLGGAAVTALFASGSPVLGCISILLFNMTMPITLTILAGIWKELPGFAFGTLMMALFLGTLPNMAFHVSGITGPVVQLVLCLVSLGLLAGSVTIDRRQHRIC